MYEKVNLEEDTPVQYVGVYVTRWLPEWGEPTVGFLEVEPEAQIESHREYIENLRGIIKDRDADLLTMYLVNRGLRELLDALQ